MSARGKARKRAVDVLFEADLRAVDPLEVLLATERRREAERQAPLNDYARELVEGVCANRERIDELLATYSHGWTLPRMPAVDRAILRVAAFELLWQDDVPSGVVISEAVDLAGELSTDDSGTFVNGLLARIDEVRPTV